jgi:hypothetical protein
MRRQDTRRRAGRNGCFRHRGRLVFRGLNRDSRKDARQDSTGWVGSGWQEMGGDSVLINGRPLRARRRTERSRDPGGRPWCQWENAADAHFFASLSDRRWMKLSTPEFRPWRGRLQAKPQAERGAGERLLHGPPLQRQGRRTLRKKGRGGTY